MNQESPGFSRGECQRLDSDSCAYESSRNCVSGLVVMYGFLTNKRLHAWAAVFSTTTALTSINRFPLSIQRSDASHR
jgi:hypothetical protein